MHHHRASLHGSTWASLISNTNILLTLFLASLTSYDNIPPSAHIEAVNTSPVKSLASAVQETSGPLFTPSVSPSPIPNLSPAHDQEIPRPLFNPSLSPSPIPNLSPAHDQEIPRPLFNPSLSASPNLSPASPAHDLPVAETPSGGWQDDTLGNKSDSSSLSDASDKTDDEMDATPKKTKKRPVGIETDSSSSSDASDKTDDKMDATPKKTQKRPVGIETDSSSLSDPRDDKMDVDKMDVTPKKRSDGMGSKSHRPRKRPRKSSSGTRANPIDVELSVPLWEHRTTPDFVRIMYLPFF
jgi:hypothetical protein